MLSKASINNISFIIVHHTIYYNQNDYANAKTYFNQALQLNPNNAEAKKFVAYINSVDSAGKLDKAYNLYNENKYPEALTLLNEIIKQTPDNGTAYYYRGLVYDAQSKYTQAIADYQNSVKYSPDLTLAYYSIGVDYDNLAKYSDAKASYKKFVELSKESNEYTDYAKKRIDEIKI